MAGEEGMPGRCTAEQKAATSEEISTDGERCTSDQEDDYDYEWDYDQEEEYDDYYEPQFLEQRHKVRALVLNFPEAAQLQLHELDEVVDRILEQSKPEHADLAAPGKIRLLREDIELAIVPNWFYKHEEPDDKSGEDKERERFRAMVRKDLVEKGYVEVDEDYYEKKDEYERRMQREIAEEWKQIDFSRFRVANNEDGVCYYSEEHGGYI